MNVNRLLRKRKGGTACCCLCSLFQLISSPQICAQVLSFSCVVCFALNISCALLSRSNLPNDWIWFHLGSESWMLPPLVQTDCILILGWRILYSNNICFVMIPYMAVIYWTFEYFPSSLTLEEKIERVWGLKFVFFNSLLAIGMHSKTYILVIANYIKTKALNVQIGDLTKCGCSTLRTSSVTDFGFKTSLSVIRLILQMKIVVNRSQNKIFKKCWSYICIKKSIKRSFTQIQM